MRSTCVIPLVIAATVGCGSGSDERSTKATDAGSPNATIEPSVLPWQPLEPTESYGGKSLGEWAVSWMQWSFSQTSCDSGNYDADGSMCRLYQEDPSPVFFMAYAPSKQPRTRCTVPQGRALLVPLANIYTDDGGSTKTRSLEELDMAAQRVLDTMRDLRLRIDGQDIEGLDRYLVKPTRYSYIVPEEPNWYSCNGFKGVSNVEIDPAVVAGYFVLLPPPALGVHELEYGGVLTFDKEDYSLQMVNRFEVVAD